jgi:hypothetical protein
MGALTPAHVEWCGSYVDMFRPHIFGPAFLAVLSYCSEADHSQGSNITAFYNYLSIVSSFLPSKRNVCGKIIQTFLNKNKSCADYFRCVFKNLYPSFFKIILKDVLLP